jgi:hypothetical protein
MKGRNEERERRPQLGMAKPEPNIDVLDRAGLLEAKRSRTHLKNSLKWRLLVLTYNPISQNNDDHFYTAVCAYIRGKPNGVVPGTVGEEQADIAKRLLQENPAILDDKDRLLAEIATIHYRESGIEANEAWWAEWKKKHEDDLFADLVAYVRGEPHKIEPGTIGETWAEHAKQLAAEDPIILDDQKRLLAAVRGCSPPGEAHLEPPKGGLVHNGRVNRDCISKIEYRRRMEERRTAGLLIDAMTAEIDWNYAQTLDPYGDGLPLLPQEEQIGREYFARAPDSDIWVCVGDLPHATRDAIWRRFEHMKGAILRVTFDQESRALLGAPPASAAGES